MYILVLQRLQPVADCVALRALPITVAFHDRNDLDSRWSERLKIELEARGVLLTEEAADEHCEFWLAKQIRSAMFDSIWFNKRTSLSKQPVGRPRCKTNQGWHAFGSFRSVKRAGLNGLKDPSMNAIQQRRPRASPNSSTDKRPFELRISKASSTVFERKIYSDERAWRAASSLLDNYCLPRYSCKVLL